MHASPYSEPRLRNAALVIQRLTREQTNLLINEHVALLHIIVDFFMTL